MPPRNAIRRIETDDGFTMLIGPTVDGTLLEVGVIDFDGDDPAVIHAMVLRSSYGSCDERGSHDPPHR